MIARDRPLGTPLGTIHIACNGRGSPKSSNVCGSPSLGREALCAVQKAVLKT